MKCPYCDTEVLYLLQVTGPVYLVEEYAEDVWDESDIRDSVDTKVWFECPTCRDVVARTKEEADRMIY